MTQTVFIRLDTLAPRASAGGTQSPAVIFTLCSAALINLAFIDAADNIGPLTGEGIAVKACVKARPNDTTAFLLDADCADNGEEGADSRRVAEWSDEEVDGEGLREFLGKSFSRTGGPDCGPWLEIAITRDGKTDRVSFPITFRNALIRPEDVAPDPRIAAAEVWLSERAIRFDAPEELTPDQQAQALTNIGIEGIKSISLVRGCLRLVLTNDSVCYGTLAPGEPPSLS